MTEDDMKHFAVLYAKIEQFQKLVKDFPDCPKCEGMGWIDGEKPCMNCQMTGKVQKKKRSRSSAAGASKTTKRSKKRSARSVA